MWARVEDRSNQVQNPIDGAESRELGDRVCCVHRLMFLDDSDSFDTKCLGECTASSSTFCLVEYSCSFTQFHSGLRVFNIERTSQSL